MPDTDTVAITVNAVNDPPANTVPGSQSVNEDTTLRDRRRLRRGRDSAALTTTLTVTNGTLTVTGGRAISGNGTATVTINGTAAQINTALAELPITATSTSTAPTR